jgi:hypothetical protein
MRGAASISIGVAAGVALTADAERATASPAAGKLTTSASAVRSITGTTGLGIATH